MALNMRSSQSRFFTVVRSSGCTFNFEIRSREKFFYGLKFVVPGFVSGTGQDENEAPL